MTPVHCSSIVRSAQSGTSAIWFRVGHADHFRVSHVLNEALAIAALLAVVVLNVLCARFVIRKSRERSQR